MKIWTFWEPRDKMPVYLQLCMRTWKKFLPEAEVTVVDYANLDQFVNVSEYKQILFSGKFTLPIIADAVRVFLLAEHGGIWLDVDTIFLNRSVRNYFSSSTDKVIFFGNASTLGVHLACIIAPTTPPPIATVSLLARAHQGQDFEFQSDVDEAQMGVPWQ